MLFTYLLEIEACSETLVAVYLSVVKSIIAPIRCQGRVVILINDLDALTCARLNVIRDAVNGVKGRLCFSSHQGPDYEGVRSSFYQLLPILTLKPRRDTDTLRGQGGSCWWWQSAVRTDEGHHHHPPPHNFLFLIIMDARHARRYPGSSPLRLSTEHTGSMAAPKQQQ